jgi:lysophospholipase L1-like esterase
MDVVGLGLAKSYAKAQTRRPNTVVLLGDSITRYNGPNTSGTATFHGQTGYWTWASRELRHRLRVLANVSTTGHTSAQILARFDGEVAPLAPGYVVVLAGRNDGQIGAPATIANLAAIYDKCDAIGAVVIALTLPPGNGLTAAQRTADNAINAWIKRQARHRRRFVVADISPVLQDINGNFITPTLSSDGIHPNGLGARRMGRVVAGALESVVPSVDVLASNNDDAANLVNNPLMASTFGTVNTGGTGTVASQWQAGLIGTGGAYVASKVAATDRYTGVDWQQIQVTATGTGGAQVFQYVSSAKRDAAIADGGLYVATCEFEIDAGMTAPTYLGGYASGPHLRVWASNGSFSTLAVAFDLYADGSELYPLENHERSGVMRTAPIAIPAGTVNLQVAANLCAVGTMRVRRFDFRKVVAPDLVL